MSGRRRTEEATERTAAGLSVESLKLQQTPIGRVGLVGGAERCLRYRMLDSEAVDLRRLRTAMVVLESDSTRSQQCGKGCTKICYMRVYSVQKDRSLD